MLTCSYMNLHVEIMKLHDIFLKNGYPRHLLDNIVNSFLLSKFVSEILTKNDASDIKYCLKIPYVGKPSLKFKNHLCKLFKIHLILIFQ